MGYGSYNNIIRPIFDPYFYILSECSTGSCFKEENFYNKFITKIQKYMEPLESFSKDSIIYNITWV